MAWFKGSTSDWKDMMDILAEIGGDEHLSAVSIYDGGSGYAVGELIALVGGTFNLAAQLEVREIQTGDTVATVASIVDGGTGYNVGDLVAVVGGTGTVVAVLEVTTEAGNVVTGLQINDPGIYSVQPAGTLATAKTTGSGDDALTVTLTWNSGVTGIATSAYVTNAGSSTVTPTNPVATTASASGTGLIFDLTWAETAWETLMNLEPQEAVSAVVVAGGSGYAVGDKITVVGGAGTVIEYAIFEVATLAATAVATVTLDTAGYYHTVTGNPAATSAIVPGVGVGCTLTVTYQGYESATETDFKQLILHNTTEDVYVGIEAFNLASNDADCWRVCQFTGFASLLVKFSEQPGYGGDECYVTLHDSTFVYNLSITDRRIAGIFNIGSGSTYTNMFLGLIDPYMTAAEYPYPSISLGCVSTPVKYTYSGSSIGGMHNPGSALSTQAGPGLIRKADGTFDTIRNWYYTGSYILSDWSKTALYPIGNHGYIPKLAEERWYDIANQDSWFNVVRVFDVDDAAQEKIKRLNDLYTLVPVILVNGPDYKMIGRLSGVYWFDNADGALAANDRIWVSGVAYRVYPNCKKSNKNNMFCIEEG